MELGLQPWIMRPTLAHAFQRGDKVQVFSAAEGWLEGVVTESCTLPNHDEVDEGKSMQEDVREEWKQDLHVTLTTVLTKSGVVSIPLEDTTRLIRKAARVSIIAPGAGVGSVGSVYEKLGSSPKLMVEVVGKKGILYDRYPEHWDTGAAPPNLQTFAEDLVRMGIPNRSDCFIFGSRGGQVVLPVMWQHMGNLMPPAIVVNGGCAMPNTSSHWPASAVTLMLLGGDDFFRGAQSSEEYLFNTCQQVPAENVSTALLYIPEMKHMPQEDILSAVLPSLVDAALAWSKSKEPPLKDLLSAVEALEFGGWGGRLRFTSMGFWQELVFGAPTVERPPAPPSPRPPKRARCPCPPGTAVSVTPIHVALAQTLESHYETAAHARKIADDLSQDPQNHTICKRLLEFADGQDAEAWAAEGEVSRTKLQAVDKKQMNYSMRPPTRARSGTSGASSSRRLQSPVLLGNSTPIFAKPTTGPLSHHALGQCYFQTPPRAQPTWHSPHRQLPTAFQFSQRSLW
mmetsp:Transcript_119874/g.188020  ORF Transcript_119874/g.188020 Transcript_119874/m.188020 type:complete len:511 (+) Transcript_119874:42-1574(+)